MGWEVIAIGSIEVHCASENQIQALIVNLNEFDSVIRQSYDYEIKNGCIKNQWIHIELSGNKGIDYSILEKMLIKCEKDGMELSCHLGEYWETGNFFEFGT
jgi:hypothetical protein